MMMIIIPVSVTNALLIKSSAILSLSILINANANSLNNDDDDKPNLKLCINAFSPS